MCAFANGLSHRPQTTFGTVKADVLVDQDRVQADELRRGDPQFPLGLKCSQTCERAVRRLDLPPWR